MHGTTLALIEQACGRKAIRENLPMQPGDVPATYANVDPLIADAGFKPATGIEDMKKTLWAAADKLRADFGAAARAHQ